MELQCHFSPGASDLIATSSDALTDTHRSSPLFEGIKVTKREQQLQVLEWISEAPIPRCC